MKKIGKLYDVDFIALESTPKDKVYISDSVQIIEKYNSQGELIDAELRSMNGELIPAPKFISEYKERVKNFGKVFVIMGEKKTYD